MQRCGTGAEILVSAPFYSASSLEWIRPSAGGRLEFWTRLNPFDWARGASDPEGLLRFLEDLGEERLSALRVHRALHAKLYIVDEDWAWVGSANLSQNAFNRNVELICELEGEDARQACSAADSLRGSLTDISIEQLRDFVDLTRDTVDEHHERSEIELSDDMQAAIELAEEVLTGVRERREFVPMPPLDEFIAYLRVQPETAANVLTARHEGENNLQGHVKQSYYGAMLFLLDPHHAELRRILGQLEFDDVPPIPPRAVEEWQTYCDEHAPLQDEEYGFDLSVLRRILPESWGGYTSTGGGASPTFKRVLPLAARFIDSEGLT